MGKATLHLESVSITTHPNSNSKHIHYSPSVPARACSVCAVHCSVRARNLEKRPHGCHVHPRWPENCRMTTPASPPGHCADFHGYAKAGRESRSYGSSHQLCSMGEGGERDERGKVKKEREREKKKRQEMVERTEMRG